LIPATSKENGVEGLIPATSKENGMEGLIPATSKEKRRGGVDPRPGIPEFCKRLKYQSSVGASVGCSIAIVPTAKR
jgi:hypothetical protein